MAIFQGRAAEPVSLFTFSVGMDTTEGAGVVGAGAGAGNDAGAALPLIVRVISGRVAFFMLLLAISHHSTLTSGRVTVPGWVATKAMASVRTPVMPLPLHFGWPVRLQRPVPGALVYLISSHPARQPSYLNPSLSG